MRTPAYSSAFAHIEQLRDDRQRPIGARLLALREIVAAAEKAERQLLMQTGVDLAKSLFAKGIYPTGELLGERFPRVKPAPPAPE